MIVHISILKELTIIFMANYPKYYNKNKSYTTFGDFKSISTISLFFINDKDILNDKGVLDKIKELKQTIILVLIVFITFTGYALFLVL